MSIDLGAASDGELRRVAQRIEAEVARREDLADDARRQQFATEMAEIDAGQRLPYDEHVHAASPGRSLRGWRRGSSRTSATAGRSGGGSGELGRQAEVQDAADDAVAVAGVPG